MRECLVWHRHAGVARGNEGIGELQNESWVTLLDSPLDEAARRELTLREALAFLCELEIARKDERRIEMGLSIARFPFGRELGGFDSAAQPALGPRLVRELATGRFVASGEAVLPLGPPGVGKAHLAVAIGRDVILAGYTLLFVSAPVLVAALAKAHGEGKLKERLAHYAKPKLLIVDELGYLPVEPSAAHLFFQLVSRRYERGSLLVTSNRAVGGGTVFGDPVVATAILDRLLHHSHVITIRGDSSTGCARSATLASSRGATRRLRGSSHRPNTETTKEAGGSAPGPPGSTVRKRNQESPEKAA